MRSDLSRDKSTQDAYTNQRINSNANWIKSIYYVEKEERHWNSLNTHTQVGDAFLNKFWITVSSLCI